MEKDYLDGVLGMEPIKDEMRRIVSWYQDYEAYARRNIPLPQGILFFGNPGTGKTFLANHVSRAFRKSYFLETLNGWDINQSFLQIMKEAREGPKPAIIVLEELDLLTKNDNAFQRLLQDQMDGHEDNRGILFLATTNEIQEIPDTLLRQGRFNYKIRFANVRPGEAPIFFRGFFQRAGIELDEDSSDFCAHFYEGSIAGIQALATEILLRFGKHPKRTEIQWAIEALASGNMLREKTRQYNWDVCCHEAGHAFMAYYLKKDLCFLYSTVESAGVTVARPVETNTSKKHCLADTLMDVSGDIACRILLGEPNDGALGDFRRLATTVSAMRENGMFGVRHIRIRRGHEDVSEWKLRKEDRLQTKWVVKSYRKAYWILWRHRKDVEKIATFLRQNGSIARKEIEECLKNTEEGITIRTASS